MNELFGTPDGAFPSEMIVGVKEELDRISGGRRLAQKFQLGLGGELTQDGFKDSFVLAGAIQRQRRELETKRCALFFA